jgi:hypothetical protein
MSRIDRNRCHAGNREEKDPNIGQRDTALIANG